MSVNLRHRAELSSSGAPPSKGICSTREVKWTESRCNNALSLKSSRSSKLRFVSSVDRAKRAGGGVGNKRKVGGRGNRGWFHRGERERVSIFEDQFYFNPIERR